MRWGDRRISRNGEERYLALLWVDLFEIYSGRESASISAVEVGDGARLWRVFEVILE